MSTTLNLGGKGVRVFVTNHSDRVHPMEVLNLLGEQGISSLLVEGGGEVNGSFFDHELVDKVIVYIAPKIIGGRDAPTFAEGIGIERMNNAIDLTNVTVHPIGRDFKFVGYPAYRRA